MEVVATRIVAPGVRGKRLVQLLRTIATLEGRAKMMVHAALRLSVRME